MPDAAGALGFEDAAGGTGIGSGAGGGASSGSGAVNRSNCGAPASASRGRRRHNRNAVPPTRASPASSHGQIGSFWSGAKGASGVDDGEGVPKVGRGIGDGAAWTGAGSGEGEGALVKGGDARGVGVGPVVSAGRGCSRVDAMRRATGGAEEAGVLTTGAAAGLPAAEAAAGCSLGFVTLPDRLKFWSSRGPTASEGDVVAVGLGDCWAS